MAKYNASLMLKSSAEAMFVIMFWHNKQPPGTHWQTAWMRFRCWSGLTSGYWCFIIFSRKIKYFSVLESIMISWVNSPVQLICDNERLTNSLLCQIRVSGTQFSIMFFLMKRQFNKPSWVIRTFWVLNSVYYFFLKYVDKNQLACELLLRLSLCT